MKTKRFVMLFAASATALVACVVLLSTFSSVQLASASSPALVAERIHLAATPVPPVVPAISVTFPPGDAPYYVRQGILVHPEPPAANQPTELCGELINLDEEKAHTVILNFAVGSFGIGMPFTPVGDTEVVVPSHGRGIGCVIWIPEHDGPWTVQARILWNGVEIGSGQRNIDQDEPLRSGEPHGRPFPVRNPFDHPISVTLGLIPHLPDWGLELSPDVLPNMAPGEIREANLTVIPPDGLPPDGTPIVDVEGRVGDELVGGFRKIFRPPVRLHNFSDPPYAEREISVEPYPLHAGEPAEVCVELRNPTPWPYDVTVWFSVADLGIGLPFEPISGPRVVHLPPHSIVRECIHWIPPHGGQMCLQVEMEMEGYGPQRSRLNLDVDEPLAPGEPHGRPFPVRNPFDHPISVTLGLIPHLSDWGLELSPDVLPDLAPGEIREVNLTVIPPAGLPPDGTPIVDVEGRVGDELIGGLRKIFRPAVRLHRFADPPYAEREISINPYPLRAGEPTEVCVELRNPTPFPRDVTILFSYAHLGIGLPFTPINGARPARLPPFGIVKECIHWIPALGGQMCLQVEMKMDGFAPQHSRLNLDVDEPLEPGVPHSRTFPVGNPFDHPISVTLGLLPRLPDWGLELSHDVLPDMAPGQIREVTLTVTPPDDLPPDGAPIVDVEGFFKGELIGGFRKIFRPPVPVHRPRDPIYAESEIFIHPYPPRAHEPAEVGVEIRNPSAESQIVTLTLSAAAFGIGMPFTPIHEPIVLELPPQSSQRPAIMWLPPEGGLWCIQVEIELPGHDELFFSQLNLDVGEPLEPEMPHSRPFPVRNPFAHPISITLGLIPHVSDWGLELSQDVLANMDPGEVREVVLTVTPPLELPPDGAPIVDVEGFGEGKLIGGFRKIFRPPVPIHRPKDPIYAESEIGVDPYPVVAGNPVELSVEVFNPTDQDRIVTATFSIARFGIGLPFSPASIAPNPILIFVPAHGAARGHVIWQPHNWQGQFCVRVTLEMEGQDPLWSQRNIDIGEPLQPGVPHALEFPVGGWPHTQAVTVTLGLVPHREGWNVNLSENMLPNVAQGQSMTVTLTVTPPLDAELGSGEPIVDVEGFVEGQLIGGFRKLDRPLVPLHKPHEKGYAESEIRIEPYPPQKGVPSQVSTVLQNTGDAPVTVELEFGWARFGMGIPFTTTGMLPPTQSVTLSPQMTHTTYVTWTPTFSGHQCVLVRLNDPDGQYPPQESQRNVDVQELPPCGETQTFTFTVRNNSPVSATVDIGLITFNVPADWKVSTVPSDTLVIGPSSEGMVTVTVTIPCPPNVQAAQTRQQMRMLQAAAGSVPTIDVEGYIQGKLVGGIELRFEEKVEQHRTIYLPAVANQ